MTDRATALVPADPAGSPDIGFAAPEVYVESYEIFKGRSAKRLTPAGLATLEQLSRFAAVKDIAGLFGVSETWLRTQIRETEANGEMSAASAAFVRGEALGRIELAQAAHSLALVNPTANVFAQKTQLGRVPIERKEVSTTIHVVGATSDATADEWRARFSNAEDAEIIDVAPEPTQETKK